MVFFSFLSHVEFGVLNLHVSLSVVELVGMCARTQIAYRCVFLAGNYTLRVYQSVPESGIIACKQQ